MSSRKLVDDKSYTNLELGAGCGNFGQQYYPKCYLTDSNESLASSCSVCYIDWFCDACKVPWTANRFERIILCNPYGYGFREEDEARLLLAEILRVIKITGEIIIICHHTNKYCAPQRVKKRLDNVNFEGVNLRYQEEDINSSLEFPAYKFQTSEGLETFPNKKLTIHVTK